MSEKSDIRRETFRLKYFILEIEYVPRGIYFCGVDCSLRYLTASRGRNSSPVRSDIIPLSVFRRGSADSVTQADTVLSPAR